MDRPLDETCERREPACLEGQKVSSGSSEGAEPPATISTGPPQFAAVGSEDLATRKLRLEIKALEFRHSFIGHAIDLLQIILPVAALLTFTWTVIIGLKQQSRQVAEDQRTQFANAYIQLGSALPAQRISGIAQLNGLIGSAGEQRDQEVFIALINQLSLETDTTVGTALMSLFSKIGPETRAVTKTAILETIANRQFSIAGGSGLDPTQPGIFPRSAPLSGQRGELLGGRRPKKKNMLLID